MKLSEKGHVARYDCRVVGLMIDTYMENGEMTLGATKLYAAGYVWSAESLHDGIRDLKLDSGLAESDRSGS